MMAMPSKAPQREQIGIARDHETGLGSEQVDNIAKHDGSVGSGDFMVAIPAPRTIGRIELADGTRPQGFLCEAYAVDGAQEITHWGGWRRYLERDP